MKCDAFETRLHALLDERLRPESDHELLAHADVCAACRETLALYEALQDGLDARNLPEPSDGFALRVLGSLPEKPSLTRSVLQMLIPLGLAAGALIALRPFLFDAAPTPVAPENQIEVATADPTNPTNPQADVDLSQQQYLSMIRLTGHAMATLPNAVRRVTIASDHGPMADGIRPLTHSFNAALDALRNTLPSKPAAPPAGESQS